MSFFSPPKETCNASEDTSDTVFIAFARVYSGTIKKGQQLYVLGPKHDPAKALSTVSINLENSYCCVLNYIPSGIEYNIAAIAKY